MQSNAKLNITLPKINLQEYELGVTLRTGFFGRVRVGKNKKGNYVAMKIMKKSEILRSKQTVHIMSEICILSKISHPFIIGIDGVNQDEKNLYLALELVNGGELFAYLRGEGTLDLHQSM